VRRPLIREALVQLRAQGTVTAEGLRQARELGAVARMARDFNGSISGDEVRIASNIGEVHGAALTYRFTGKLSGDTMSGALDMGEYLGAKWTAKRHPFGRGGGDQG